MKKKGLNKGLDSLLGDLKSFREKESFKDPKNKDKLIEIDINLIKPNPKQPRKYFNSKEILELAESIQSQGIIQPIVVLKKGEKYQIIAGERRLRAARKINLKKVPCVVKQVGEKVASVMSLIENLQREDLNPIERARSFNQLILEFNYTHEALAKVLGLSRVVISNTLRLLKLAEPIRQALISKKIDMGHARAMVSLAENKQIGLCKKIINQNLTTRQVEKISQSILSQGQTERKEKKRNIQTNPNITRLEEKLANKLATKVKINHQQSGKGVIKIHYLSLESLATILKRIK